MQRSRLANYANTLKPLEQAVNVSQEGHIHLMPLLFSGSLSWRKNNLHRGWSLRKGAAESSC